MTKNSEYSYWVPQGQEKFSFAFADHVKRTAMTTGRPHYDMSKIEADPLGRTAIKHLDDALDKSAVDGTFTFDCAERLGHVHLGQIGAFMAAAPTLDEALSLLTSTMFYFDDRMISAKAVRGEYTNFMLLYRRPVNASFYHIQAAALFLTLIDAWPTYHIEGSTFNFPRVEPTQQTSLTRFMGKFPWCSMTTNTRPVLFWSVKTEQLKMPSPNYNPEWWIHCQKFLRWGLDTLAEAEPFRKPWCRFATASMMTEPKNLTLNHACRLSGVTNKTLSKKLSSEGYNAAALKLWIHTEMAQRCEAAGLSEEWIANAFGYSVAEFRAMFKRKEVVNPYHASPAEKARVKRNIGLNPDTEFSLNVA